MVICDYAVQRTSKWRWFQRSWNHKERRWQSANFGKDISESAWNNEYMKSVRTTMMAGNISASLS